MTWNFFAYIYYGILGNCVLTQKAPLPGLLLSLLRIENCPKIYRKTFQKRVFHFDCFFKIDKPIWPLYLREFYDSFSAQFSRKVNNLSFPALKNDFTAISPKKSRKLNSNCNWLRSNLFHELFFLNIYFPPLIVSINLQYINNSQNQMDTCL